MPLIGESLNFSFYFLNSSLRRFIHDRVREHLNNENSSVKKYIYSCQNKDYKGVDVKIIMSENDPTNLRFHEAFHIRKCKPTLNPQKNVVNSQTFYFRACLHEGGVPQIGEVTRLGGVTRLSIQSLILMWSRLHVRWGNPPHVTSPTWGPPPSCKQALSIPVLSAFRGPLSRDTP